MPPIPPPRPVLDALYERYGRTGAPEGDDLLGLLIATILSQSTNDQNSQRAFGALIDRFEGDWGLIERAPTDEVERAIRPGGLSRQKAPRIQKILAAVRARFGKHNLEALRALDPADAYAFLIELPGVGPKTASFVLMRGAAAPYFAIDTHIMRLCKRLGWIKAREAPARAHEAMRRLIPPDEYDPAHVAMIRHGRAICRPRAPRCPTCPIEELCPQIGVEGPR